MNKVCLLALLVLPVLVGIQEVHAQPITPAADGTQTQITSPARDPNQFDISGGTQAGANLFHSFEQFGLDANQIANFLSNENIQNILGRVVGGDASVINGLIQVTGGKANLFLMNPAGIVFGAGASLNVPADFTATTATGIGFDKGWFKALGDNEYSALDSAPKAFAFSVTQPGSILNAGNLSGSGNITLLGGTVVSTGELSAPGHQITVAAVPGDRVVRISQEGQLLNLEVEPLSTASEAGAWELPLQSLPDLLTGGAGGNATQVALNDAGQVVLTGSDIQVDTKPGAVTVSGVLDASNKASGQTGGTVQVLGETVALAGQARVNVSGDAGGGTVLIGGDLQGQGQVPKATETAITRNATINADAINQGNGGEVIAWAEGATRFYGSISARGGASAGAGGFVEVSGKENLAFDGYVDVGAPAGVGGQLLLDPARVVIGAVGTNDDQLDDGQILGTAPGAPPDDVFLISAARIVEILNSGSVAIAATNDITIDSDIDASGNATVSGLTLASALINLNASITTNGGNITFDGPVLLGSSETISTGAGSGNIAFNSTLNAVNGPQDLTLTAGTGNITFSGAVGSPDFTLPGSTGLTFRVSDINPGADNSSPGSVSSADFTAVDGTIYFSANDGTTGFELWQSDGTSGGTQLVRDINPGSGSSFPASFTPLNNTVYFSADDGSVGTELWRSDGTLAGTQLVRDINPGAGDGIDSFGDRFTALNGVLYFGANDGSVGTELWRSDGSLDGTQLVRDLNVGAEFESSNPSNFTPLNGTLYFSADDGNIGTELWRTDGSAAGTQLVRDIALGTGSGISAFSSANFTPVNGTLFFSADNGTVGTELWRSDGTFAGTQLVRDIRVGDAFASSNPSNLTPLSGVLFFSANDGTVGTELWRSDGTVAGTHLVQDINVNGVDSSNPSNLTPLNGVLFFSANNGTVGTELWRSDGTFAGTQLVQDINAGAESGISFGPNFTPLNGVLYFSADNGSVGAELWRTDGTTAGTQLVQDINPGANPSLLDNITVVNDRLFFSAGDTSRGIELWSSGGVPNPLLLGNLAITTTSAANITASSDITLGGNLALSATGSVDLAGALVSDGGDVGIVGTSINTGVIDTVRQFNSTGSNDNGSVNLAAVGDITTGQILTISAETDSDDSSVTLVSTAGNVIVEAIFAGSGGVDIAAAGLFQATGVLNFQEGFRENIELNTDLVNNPDLLAFLVRETGRTEESLLNDPNTITVSRENSIPISIFALDNGQGAITIRYNGATGASTDVLSVQGGDAPFVFGPNISVVEGQEFVPASFLDPPPDFETDFPFPLSRNETYSLRDIPQGVSGTAGAIIVGNTDASISLSLQNQILGTLPEPGPGPIVVDPSPGPGPIVDPGPVVVNPDPGPNPGPGSGGGSNPGSGPVVNNPGDPDSGGSPPRPDDSGDGGVQITAQVFEEQETQATRGGLCQRVEERSPTPTETNESDSLDEEECEELTQPESSQPQLLRIELELPAGEDIQPSSSILPGQSLPELLMRGTVADATAVNLKPQGQLKPGSFGVGIASPEIIRDPQ